MRNRRPEKGPLIMSIGVAIFVLVFAVIWTVTAAATVPFMALFGIFFVGFAIAQIIMIVSHASGKKHHSSFPDREEETENRYAKPQATANEKSAQRYCPSCGAKAGADFTFCSDCGRRLPDWHS